MIARKRKRPIALIVNPTAGRLEPRRRVEVERVLGAKFEVELLETEARDAAIELARDAAARSDAVVAFGGDGHVNEVVNGLAGTKTPLGIIPGGTMNVFARALGIPTNPVAAAAHLLAAVGTKPRNVPLGKMDERFFTFSAGCGFDAETADRVNRDLRAKRRWGEMFFYWSAFRVLGSAYRHRGPSLIVEGPWGRVPAAMTVVSNCGPYAYFLGRPITLAPNVALDGHLDVFALHSLDLGALPRYIWRTAVSNDLVRDPSSFYASNVEEVTISGATEFARHTDGESLPPKAKTHVSIVADSLRVYA